MKNKKICFIISISILLISLISLVIFMNINKFEIQPFVFEIVKIFMLVLINICILTISLKKSDNRKFLIIFVVLIIVIVTKIKNINLNQEILIENNVKLVKIRNKKTYSLDYYKYINIIFMSKEKLMKKQYDYDFFNSTHFYEGAKEADVCELYYNDQFKRYSESKINIICRKSYDLEVTQGKRFVSVITDESELEEFNNEVYNISKEEKIDFSKYNLIVLTYNQDEIMSYIGILDNDFNLVIKKLKNKDFSKLLIIKIEKMEFKNIKISDFDTYINPI